MKCFKNLKWRPLAALALPLAAVLALAPGRASAYELVIANYGSSTAAWPFAVAFEGGFLKREGLDVSAIRATNGGTTELRTMLAGDLPFAATTIQPVLDAIKQGEDLKIINETVHTSANDEWVTMPNSSITTISADSLRGKRIGFTAPKSNSEMLDRALLQKVGLTDKDVKLIALNSFGAELTALQNGGVDVVSLSEPLYTLSKGKYKLLGYAKDWLPPMNSNVGVTSGKVAREHPEILRGVIEANRKAVDYMKTNPKESAMYIDKVFKVGPDAVESIMNELIEHGDTQVTVDGKSHALPYWGRGDIYAPDIDNLITALKLVGALDGDVDWRKAVDQSFLPDDLKTKM